MEKIVLNAGCGYAALMDSPYGWEFQGWDELRLDCDQRTKPHICNNILDMHGVSDGCVDAVYSCHTLEHLYTSAVIYALKEFWRVLKPGGFVSLFLPDFEKVAKIILDGNVDRVLYKSSGGPIRPVDIVFGYEGAIKDAPLMMHKTLITVDLITQRLKKAKFEKIDITRDNIDIWVKAFKPCAGSGKTKSKPMSTK